MLIKDININKISILIKINYDKLDFIKKDIEINLNIDTWMIIDNFNFEKKEIEEVYINENIQIIA